jgi:hypothetical protein
MSFQLELRDGFYLTTRSCILQNIQAQKWFYSRVVSTHTLRLGEGIQQDSSASELSAHPPCDGYSAM